MGADHDRRPEEVPIESLVRHRPPFLFVRRLVACEPGHSVAELRIDPSWLWPGASTVPRVLLIDALAQTVAAAVGFESLAFGAPCEEGLLVAVRRFRFYADPPIGAPLLAETWEGRMMKPFGMGRGEVRWDDTLVARGDLQFLSFNPDGGRTEKELP